jgi:hypothetical protein
MTEQPPPRVLLRSEQSDNRLSVIDGSNTPIGSRWQPTATVSERM